jgi:arylsulfatase A-like enzyme
LAAHYAKRPSQDTTVSCIKTSGFEPCQYASARKNLESIAFGGKNTKMTDRENSLKALFTCMVVLAVWNVSNSAIGAETCSERRPNIIFFLVDDYDKPETSVYGGDVLTPNLDRLAREGMTLTNAHMTSTVCTPSRYTCLTGRYAGASTSSYFLNECPRGQQGLPAFNVELEADNMNVGQVLQDSGYATGFVGKYHVGPHIDEWNAKRFDWQYIPKNAEYSEDVQRMKLHNQQRACALIRERGFSWAKNIYWENMKAPFKGHNPEWTIAAALEFIDQHKDGPFYLHCATTLLHGPNGEWFRSLSKPLVSDEGMLDKPIGIMDRDSVMARIREAGLSENEAGYLWMDDSVGILLERLEQHGIAENTVFVFLADHGSQHKGSLLKNRGTEVPCLIRWPAGIKPGVRCDELIQNTDFVATWFDVAKAKVPEGYRLDGVSLVPLFKDPNEPVRDYVYSEMGPARSVKTKQWNYIALRYTEEHIEAIRIGHRSVKQLMGLSGGVSRAKTYPHAFDPDQLYDLVNDPSETNNVAAKPRYGESLEEMKRLLKRELLKFPNRPFGEFIPGGNAVGIEGQTGLVQRLRRFAAARK